MAKKTGSKKIQYGVYERIPGHWVLIRKFDSEEAAKDYVHYLIKRCRSVLGYDIKPIKK